MSTYIIWPYALVEHFIFKIWVIMNLNALFFSYMIHKGIILEETHTLQPGIAIYSSIILKKAHTRAAYYNIFCYLPRHILQMRERTRYCGWE